MGDEGNDMLLGDYGRIIMPTLIGTGVGRFEMSFGDEGHHNFVNTSRSDARSVASDIIDGGPGEDLIDAQRGGQNVIIGNDRRPRSGDFERRIDEVFSLPLNQWIYDFVTIDVWNAARDFSLESLLALGIAG